MTAPASQDTQDERIFALEERLAEAIAGFDCELGDLRNRVRRVEAGAPVLSAGGTPIATTPGARPVPPPRRPAATPFDASSPTPAHTEASAPVTDAAPAGSPGSLGDLIGGRLLAWAGGIATLLGIALFLALAISHGWIGEEARVLLAGAVSLALLGGGSWLHTHRGRTEAAIAMAGAGVAGLFATLIVASAVYQLIPGLVALAGALAVGATATRLAVRWAGRPLAGIGLVGALAAPALVGAPAEWPTLAMMLVTAGFAMWVASRRGWAWLALATVAVSAPQWAVPMLEGQSVGEDLFVLVAFAAVGLAGAIACERNAGERRPASALAALILSAAATALVGRVALAHDGTETIANVWLAVLAGVHLALGASRRPALGRQMRAVLLSLGLVLANVAFALSFDGLVLAVGWSASAVGLAALTRSRDRGESDGALRELGVGLQLSLALARALISAPPSTLLSGEPALAGLLAVGSFACAALVCAGLEGHAGRARDALTVVGFARPGLSDRGDARRSRAGRRMGLGGSGTARARPPARRAPRSRGRVRVRRPGRALHPDRRRAPDRSRRRRGGTGCSGGRAGGARRARVARRAARCARQPRARPVRAGGGRVGSLHGLARGRDAARRTGRAQRAVGACRCPRADRGPARLIAAGAKRGARAADGDDREGLPL